MRYDFTSTVDRRGMDAIAVDGPGHGGWAPGGPKEGFDVIPMWVADMNFPTCPTIQEAVIERTKHPMFGYFDVRDEYYDSIIRWQSERHGMADLTKKCIGYENGVLGGVVSALNAFACPGDAVLVHSPTYIGFTGSIEGAGYRIVLSPLKKDESGVWRMDYEDMDRKIKENHIHVAVFCNPHNPCGRVWTEEEIRDALEIYRRNEVIVIDDEIRSDIILGNHRHVPTQMVSSDARRRTISLFAPSKTFNLAGLVGSYHIIYDAYLRDRVRSASAKSHYNAMNVLSMHALIGAYRPEGALWVDELCEVLTDNIGYACSFMEEKFKGLHFSRPEGTYMLFIDAEEWCRAHGKTLDELLRAGWDVGVIWQDGRPFHGEFAIRMNFALPRSRIEEAMARLQKYVFDH